VGVEEYLKIAEEIGFESPVIPETHGQPDHPCDEHEGFD
jgi:hypothetical protein